MTDEAKKIPTNVPGATPVDSPVATTDPINPVSTTVVGKETGSVIVETTVASNPPEANKPILEVSPLPDPQQAPASQPQPVGKQNVIADALVTGQVSLPPKQDAKVLDITHLKGNLNGPGDHAPTWEAKVGERQERRLKKAA